MRQPPKAAASRRERRLAGFAVPAVLFVLAIGLLATAAAAAEPPTLAAEAPTLTTPGTDADTRAVTTLALSATPAVVDYGGTAVLSGRLSIAGAGAGDTGVAGATLTVTSSTDGLLWSDVTTVGTDALGGFSTPVTPTASYGRTTFNVAFAGSDALQPTAARLAVDSRAALGAPSVPLSVGRGSLFTMRGSLKPAPPAGTTAAVTIDCYRSESGLWVLRKTVTAPVQAGAGASAASGGSDAAHGLNAGDGAVYSLTMSLPAAGRWRLSASYADDAHAPTQSANSPVVTVGALPDLPVWNHDAVKTLPERMAYRGGSRQLVIATGAGPGARSGALSVFDYHAGDWVRVMATPAKFGSNGLTNGLTRHAGTRTTPTGIWRMPHYVFGRHPHPPKGTRMAYRLITPRSWWSAEYNATYNTWVETARHVDGEHLADSPGPYEFAVSSGYNALPNQRVYGRGTAIFLHVNHRGFTAGCVSVSRRAMLRLCRLLDPSRKPVCAAGTTRTGTATSIYGY